eukprot:CAMPEP_0175129170 /NCGR_PEP_ID=MMETSP0087-20121206/5325_1 /TAXON_ID=136419 /ORGANISM="Unknown Unknown, Strain D1" /LENGTH=241 /DNA_ID=CAMNT_0016411293 /DNA_START=16 /DNA_END=737 /DNA_ORIENTATION=-
MTESEKASEDVATLGELNAALKKQVQWYFSRENLAKDAFLNSQMDAQKYVNIDVIFKFRKIQTLTQDKELLVKCMRDCPGIQVDSTGAKIRSAKAQRNTLILRDIPADTPEEEVKSIFSYEGCGKVTNIRSDVDDTWFVTFEEESECLDCAMELTSRTFKGKNIMCRVKSESASRGYYNSSPRTSASDSNMYYTQNPYANPYYTNAYRGSGSYYNNYYDGGERGRGRGRGGAGRRGGRGGG